MNRKQKIILSITCLLLVFLALFGLTYAYYLTQITENNNSKSIDVTTANLRLVYADGNGILTPANNIRPGETITFYDKDNNLVDSKTFTVTNYGNKKIDNYVVVLENVVNNFYLREDMTYTLTCKSVNRLTNIETGTCSGASDIPFPRNDEIMVTSSIDKNITHKYELTLNFKETNKNQSIDMGKTLSAKINIYDRKEFKPVLTDNKDMITYINTIGTLEQHATDYLTSKGITPNTTGSSLYFKGQNKWLVFNKLRYISYKTENWDRVAGALDSGYDTYLSEQKFDSTPLETMKYIATDSGETSSLTHFSAALVARMYNTDGIYNLVLDEGDFDNLAGWAGDLQTLIRYNLIPQITSTTDYNHIYNTMSSIIGKSGTYFDSDDLYADIDAYNLYYLLSTSKTLKETMMDYYTTKYNQRFNLFITKLASSLDYNAFSNAVYRYTKSSSTWPLYDGMDKTKFTSTVEIAARDAFTDYIWLLANFKELNIFSHDIEFKKGTSVDFIAEFINIDNVKDEALTNSDYTWAVSKPDKTSSNSTITNGVLNIPSNETATELLITATLNKSNKITTSRVIKLS